VRDIENAHIRKALDTLDRPKSHYGISLGAGIIYNIDDPALAKFGYLVGLGYYGDISEKLGLDVQLNVGWFPKKITSRSELVISPPYGSNYDANTDTTSRVVAQLVAMVTTPLGNGFYAGIGPTLNFRHTNNKNSHTIYQTQFDDFGNICPPTEENGYTTYSQHDEDIFRLGIAGELGKGPVAIVGGYSPDNAWVQIKARIGLK
jgi:hypothetical protein